MSRLSSVTTTVVVAFIGLLLVTAQSNAFSSSSAPLIRPPSNAFAKTGLIIPTAKNGRQTYSASLYSQDASFSASTLPQDQQVGLESLKADHFDQSLATTNKPPSDPSKKTNRFGWIVLFVSLVGSIIPGVGEISEGVSESPSLVFSTVSATLLRTSQRRAIIDWKVLGGAALLCWNLSRAGPAFFQLISTSWIKFTVWYLHQLSATPLLTKAITASVIQFLGDGTAQAIERQLAKKEGFSMNQDSSYDRRRGLSVALDGLFVSGPLLHVMYEFLEHLIPVAGAATGIAASAAAITQVLIDDVLFDAVFVAILFCTSAIGEGHARELPALFKKDYFAILKRSWATSLALMPLEFVCFRYLPLSFRVLGMNIVDIFWGAMVSFMAHRNRKRLSTNSAQSSPREGATMEELEAAIGSENDFISASTPAIQY